MDRESYRESRERELDGVFVCVGGEGVCVRF